MKKFFFYLVFLCMLVGCSQNPIIGTWRESESKEDEGLKLSIGRVQTETYEANGDYHTNFEMQMKIGDKSSSVTGEIKGTWEMVGDKQVRIRTTTAIISGEEMKNITDELYTILTLDDETLETFNMKKGIKYKFKRVE